MKKGFLFVLLLSFFSSSLFAQIHYNSYPKIDSFYTKEVIQKYLHYYTQKHDSVGLAYTYACWTDLKFNNTKEKIEILKKLLYFHPFIKKTSEKDYNYFKIKVISYYSKDKFTIEKSINICDSVIKFARKNKYQKLELSALLHKAYFLHINYKTQDDFVGLSNDLKNLETFVKNDNTTLSESYYSYFGNLMLLKKEYEQAIHFYNLSLNKSILHNNVIFIEINWLFLARVYRLTNKIDKAIKCIDISNKLNIATQNLEHQRWANQEYALCYEALGNYKKAVYHWKRYDDFVNKIKYAALSASDFGRIKMEYIENELNVDNENLKLKNLIILEENRLKSIFIYGSIALSFLIIFLSFVIYLYYNQRVKVLNHEKKLALLEGQENEREHISKELHDNIGGLLAALIRKLTPATNDYQEINQLVSKIYASIRTMSHTLNSDAIKEVGLEEACLDYINLIDIDKKISFKTFGTKKTIPNLTATIVFRAIQELLSNALKHANAPKIDLQLFYQENQLLVSVEDNGKGFNISTKHFGIGLKNVKNRIKATNGDLEIHSNPNHGSSFLMTIPLV